MYIQIIWILRSQMVLFYTVSKQDISRVYHEKELTNLSRKIKSENGKFATLSLYKYIYIFKINF